MNTWRDLRSKETYGSEECGEDGIVGWNLHDVSEGFIGRVIGEKGVLEHEFAIALGRRM